MRDQNIFWHGNESESSQQIANLVAADGKLIFRWSGGVEPIAEAALRNSVIRLTENDFAHRTEAAFGSHDRPARI